MVLLPPVTPPAFLDINVFLPGSALVTHLFSVTSAMLHRSHILQYFQNSIKGLGISAHWGDGKFCWEGNFYVVVGIWGGVILTIQNFFRFKKQHIVNIFSVGVNVKFCRDNFFHWVVEIWGGGILTIQTILPSCFEICEGFLWIQQRNWKHKKTILWNTNLCINIA